MAEVAIERCCHTEHHGGRRNAAQVGGISSIHLQVYCPIKCPFHRRPCDVTPLLHGKDFFLISGIIEIDAWEIARDRNHVNARGGKRDRYVAGLAGQ